jgi:hypothetical protein
MLAHNIRVEEDLIDPLFNSSEKRLARTCCFSRFTVHKNKGWSVAECPARNPGGNGGNYPVTR